MMKQPSVFIDYPAMAGNFQVEDIIVHLKELRQEKVRNEQTLKNLQQERKQLEKKVEAGKLRKCLRNYFHQ